ncbi:MAG: transporter substrate-binding domain-containing protein [Burkholderiales bacterium]|nr:transporter substrate-binding domain-containing protein [Burkholderiales bacterium]
MVKVLCLGGLLLAGVAVAAQGECNHLVYTANPDYPPFHWEQNGKLVGASIEITNRILAALGVSGEARYVGPWNRVLKSAEFGSVDMVVALRRTPEREAYMEFEGEPFSDNPTAAFVDLGEPMPYSQWDDLTNARVGASNGDRYGGDFDAFLQAKLHPIYATDMEHGFSDLHRHLTQYYLTGYQTGRAFLAAKGWDKQIVARMPLVAHEDVFNGFSRKSPCRKLIPAFDLRLQALRQDGSVDRALDAALLAWRDYARSKTP